MVMMRMSDKYFCKSTWLIRKRTNDHKVTQDFRLIVGMQDHYGQGRYQLLKRG